VREHVDDCATRVFDEEAANAPWLVGERVDDSEPASDGLGVHGVDCGGFTDVDTEARVGTPIRSRCNRAVRARDRVCAPHATVDTSADGDVKSPGAGARPLRRRSLEARAVGARTGRPRAQELGLAAISGFVCLFVAVASGLMVCGRENDHPRWERGCRRSVNTVGRQDAPPRGCATSTLPFSCHAAYAFTSKTTKPPLLRGFRRADDGTRTHDLLHGKQTL
jgi:hypothetical protein